jgi:hypothetical protein
MPTLKVNSWLGWRKFTVNSDVGISRNLSNRRLVSTKPCWSMFVIELSHSSWNRWSQSEEKFRADEITWANIIYGSLWYCCQASGLWLWYCCQASDASLLLRWSCWILSYDACELCEFLWIWMQDLISANFVISWLVPGWQNAAPNGCQVLAGSRMQPASRQVIVGVAYVSVMSVN